MYSKLLQPQRVTELLNVGSSGCSHAIYFLIECETTVLVRQTTFMVEASQSLLAEEYKSTHNV